MKSNRNILLVGESTQKMHLLFYESIIRSCTEEANSLRRVSSGEENEIHLFTQRTRNIVLNYSWVTSCHLCISAPSTETAFRKKRSIGSWKKILAYFWWLKELSIIRLLTLKTCMRILHFHLLLRYYTSEKNYTRIGRGKSHLSLPVGWCGGDGVALLSKGLKNRLWCPKEVLVTC